MSSSLQSASWALPGTMASAMTMLENNSESAAAYVFGVCVMCVAQDDGIGVDNTSVTQRLPIHGVPFQVLESAAGQQTLTSRPVLHHSTQSQAVQVAHWCIAFVMQANSQCFVSACIHCCLCLLGLSYVCTVCSISSSRPCVQSVCQITHSQRQFLAGNIESDHHIPLSTHLHKQSFVLT